MPLLCTKYPLKEDNLSTKDKLKWLVQSESTIRRFHYTGLQLADTVLTVCTISPPPSQEHGPPRQSGGQDPLPVVTSPSP